MIGGKVLQRASHLLLYGNFFIALCAAAATYQTQTSAGKPDWHYILFIFCATFVFYNIQRLFLSSGYTSTRHSDRHRWIRSHAPLMYLLCLGGLIASIAAVRGELPATLIAFSALAGLALCYFAPLANIRHIPFAKTLYIAAIWACATCTLPLLTPAQSLPSRLVGLLTAERFLFILALCIVFDIRDMEVDRQSSVTTLPVHFGIPATKRVAMVTIGVFIASAMARLSFIAPAADGELLALSVSALVTVAVLYRAEASSSELYYLFTVDSMILLQTALCLVLR